MSLEFRKIPNQEIQVSQLLYTTLTMQGREQRPRALALCTATPRYLGNYLVSETVHLRKILDISAFSFC